MRIESRDRTLTYPRAIHEEKRRLVLDWLLEFRFSSCDILARRLGSTVKATYGLLHTLRQQGLIQEFRSLYGLPHRFYMLTRPGAHCLAHTAHRDTRHAHTRVHRMSQYAHILHDLAVQQAVLRRLENYDEVIWDRHITLPPPFDRPDLLMHHIKRFWIAFEYERSRKEDKRIYMALCNHAQAMIQRHYQGTYFLFDRESDLQHYQALFNEAEWPEYRFNRQRSKIVRDFGTFKPDDVTNLRKCFRFIHQPANPRAS